MSTTPSALPSEWASSAAPSATASSGWTARDGSRPKNSATRRWTSGMRDCPPTRITSSRSMMRSPRASSTSRQTSMVRSTSGATSRSTSSRVTTASRLTGWPAWSAR